MSTKKDLTSHINHLSQQNWSRTHAMLWRAMNNKQKTQFYSASWDICDELTEMPDALVEQLVGMEPVLIARENVDFCAVWALANSQARWFSRDSEIDSGAVFWFESTSDALMAKLSFGGDA